MTNSSSKEPVPQASQTFEDVLGHGPPANALEFPEPCVQPAVRQTLVAWNPQTLQDELCFNVLRRRDDTNVAYWPRKRLQNAIYGSVWHCIVLKKEQRRQDHEQLDTASATRRTAGTPYESDWQIQVDKSVAVKQLVLSLIDPRSAEKPLKEVAAMQWLTRQNRGGKSHPNIVSSLDVLQDSIHLYSVMPFYPEGDLFDVVQQHMIQSGASWGLPEDVAHGYFTQILDGVQHLQDQGICHRDLSLENIMLDKHVAKIIDFGMCLRVPYLNETGEGVVDVIHARRQREPPRRVLMTPQGTCGKWIYMSPEVRENRNAMDGLAVDLWSVGIMLFIMLTGYPPFEQALSTDPRYQHLVIFKQLKKVLQQRWNVPLSDQACDLLQQMLQENPRDRLTLAQVREHPWVKGNGVKHNGQDNNNANFIEDRQAKESTCCLTPRPHSPTFFHHRQEQHHFPCLDRKLVHF